MSDFKFVCQTCGSEDLSFEAWVKWDKDKQRMVIRSVVDEGDDYCETCEDFTVAVRQPHMEVVSEQSI